MQCSLCIENGRKCQRLRSGIHATALATSLASADHILTAHEAASQLSWQPAP